MLRPGENRRSSFSTVPSEAPSRYSMTKKTRPSSTSPQSVTSQMYGLPMREAARASWRNWRSTSGFCTRSLCSSFSATLRSMSTCSAR